MLQGSLELMTKLIFYNFGGLELEITTKINFYHDVNLTY